MIMLFFCAPQNLLRKDVHTCSHMSSQRCRISEVHFESAIQLLRVKMSCPDLYMTSSKFIYRHLCQLALEQWADNGMNRKSLICAIAMLSLRASCR